MKITTKTKIGNVEYQFEVEEDTILKSINIASVLANPPKICEECGCEDLKLYSNKGGNYLYVYMLCNGCGAKANLGQNDPEKTIFWHEFKKWQGGN